MNTKATGLPPLLATGAHRTDFSSIFPPGSVTDRFLEEKIKRLDSAYGRYLNTYPYGLWAHGLIVDSEMHRLTELLLPLSEIRTAFDRLFKVASSFPLSDIPLFDRASSWLDVVPLIPPPLRILNPAALLRLAATNEELRLQLLFALHLPNRHGEGFGRYPGQTGVLREWLRDCRQKRGSLRCLDAACGTGEGTYELAMVLEEATGANGCWIVEGLSRDPFEIFSAAHAFFPHDKPREAEYIRSIQPLNKSGSLAKISFRVNEIKDLRPDVETYDIIACNGLLGGPLLHEPQELASAVSVLTSVLKNEGLIVVADRFHNGWRKKLPQSFLKKLLEDSGMIVFDPGEGVGGIKKAAA